MKNDLVSVIIPIYKVSQYLDRCVESVCKQTYRNLEIILVDDGSPDDCPQKCDRWAELDKRICVIHKQNGGLSDARNAGLDAATGPFIYFLDGDDYIEANLVEKAMSHMSDDVDMVYFGNFCDCENGETRSFVPHLGIFELYTAEQKRQFVTQDILTKAGWEAWRRILRKSVIDRFQLRFVDNREIFAEDMYFCLCYIAHTRKCVAICDCLYHYTVREDSIMGRDSIKLNVGRMNKLSDAVKSHYLQHEDSKPLLDIFPLIHFLIIWNPMQAAMNHGITMRSLRNMVFEDVRECKDAFTLKLRNTYQQKQMFYKYLDGWNATYKLNYCKFLLNGSYNELRIRNRLLHYCPILFERKCNTSQEIYAQVRKFAKNKKKIYLLGTEEFGNIGDHQIAESIHDFLKRHFPDYAVLEVTVSEYSKYKYFLKKYIRKKDIILCTGGGNLGDVYLPAHKVRIDIVKSWPDNLKLIFPQTIFFDNDTEDAPVLRECRETLIKQNKVVLVARENQSFELAKKYFTCDRLLAPDIVLSTNLQTNTDRKNQILLCFRSDTEKSISNDTVDEICRLANSTNSILRKTDLQLDYNVYKNERKKYIVSAMDLWRESKLVITDRLHGMVFAAVTGTPCIAFSNYNYKVYGTYEWIKYLPYIRYAQNVRDVEKFLPELLAMEYCEYDNTPLMPFFNEIAEVVKTYVND